jgi:hypothetical protein
VGTSGHKLLRLRTPNGGQFTTLLVVPAAGVSSPQVQRPNTDLGAYQVFEGSANASYNALQVQLAGRAWRGLDVRLAYTWSHAIDGVSDVYDVAGAYALAEDELERGGGLRLERGNAGFDVRHRFTAAWVYDLPFWRDRRWLGGWQLSGIGTFQTGQPFTVNTSVDVNFDGNLTDRLGTTDGLAISDSGRTRIVATVPPQNLLAAPGTNGIVGRNTFRAEGIASVDLAASKRFAFAADQSVTLRVEVFNLFNRTSFGIPVRVLEAPGFGSSVNTIVPPRVVQLAVRYAF